MFGRITVFFKTACRKLLRKHGTIYFLTCFIMVFLLQHACSLLPYIGKSLVYPAVFQSQEMRGQIKYTLRDSVRLPGKRSKTVRVCYFRVNDQTIQVFPSDYAAYKEGDDFTYIQYSLFDVVKGECVEYRFLWGVAGVAAIGLLGYVCTILILTIRQEEKGTEKMQKMQKMPELPEYEHLTDKELYKLCQQYGIRVPARRKKEREFLRRCLRSYSERAMRNNWKVERNMNRRSKDPVEWIITGVLVTLFIAMDIYYIIVPGYYLFYSRL